VSTVILIGAYGEANLGDDALLTANVNLLLRTFKQEDISVYCLDSAYLKRLLPGCKVIPLHPQARLQADFLVYGGGTLFFSFPLSSVRTGTLTKICSAFRSPVRSFLRLLGRYTRSRWNFNYRAALGIGLGPFEADTRKEAETCKTIRALDFVGLRDLASFKLASDQWGLANVSLGADICYCPGLLGLTCTPRASGYQPARRIGVIIRDWIHTKEGAAYVTPVRSAVTHLRDRGYEVDYLSFCQSGDQQWLEALDHAGENTVIWDPLQTDMGAFIRSLRNYDVIVTARYHGAILPALLGVPVIVIGLEQKLREVANELLGPSMLWDYPFEVAELSSKIEAVVGDYQMTCDLLAASVKKRSLAAESLVQDYLQFLDGTGRGAGPSV
jgi:polysaccharide pyruvyl transferase WcaK-like protein